MTASDRLREIGKDIHWEGSSTYNRPLVGAIALAKAFDEILLVVEVAERYVTAEDADHAAMRRLLDGIGDEDDNRDAQKETRLTADAAYDQLAPALSALEEALS